MSQMDNPEIQLTPIGQRVMDFLRRLPSPDKLREYLEQLKIDLADPDKRKRDDARAEIRLWAGLTGINGFID
jgi:hypothetical protein